MARPFSSVPETSGGLPKICAGIFVFTSTPISSFSKFAASSSLRMHQTIGFRDAAITEGTSRREAFQELEE
jgi:hypothetical protein